MRSTASSFFRPVRRRTISTAPIAPATTCSATASSRSTRAPASGCGTFRSVHHDLWDYDLTAAPKLLTIRDPSDRGKTIDIVAQAGKTGFLYVFERVTGKPIWPIEERAVPKSEVPGEVSSPTQPFPTKPPPFARQVFKADDVNPFLPAAEQERLRQAVRDAANEGLFTPSSHLRYHIQFPGAWGGANWGSTAGDPASGMLFVRSLEMPSYRRMALDVPRPPAQPQGVARTARLRRRTRSAAPRCHGPGQTPMRSPAALGLERFSDARAAGSGSDAGVPGDSAAGGRPRGARSLSGVAAGVRRSATRMRALRPAAEPEPVRGPRIALCRIVLRGLVRQQRAADRRPAVDAARCLRPQRRRRSNGGFPTATRRDSPRRAS